MLGLIPFKNGYFGHSPCRNKAIHETLPGRLLCRERNVSSSSCLLIFSGCAAPGHPRCWNPLRNVHIVYMQSMTIVALVHIELYRRPYSIVRNRDTPKSSMEWDGFSLINHPFGDIPILGNPKFLKTFKIFQATHGPDAPDPAMAAWKSKTKVLGRKRASQQL